MTDDRISIPALRERYGQWTAVFSHDPEVLALVEAVEAAQECLSHPIGSPKWERASKRLKAAHARFEFGETTQ